MLVQTAEREAAQGATDPTALAGNRQICPGGDAQDALQGKVVPCHPYKHTLNQRKFLQPQATLGL